MKNRSDIERLTYRLVVERCCGVEASAALSIKCRVKLSECGLLAL